MPSRILMERNGMHPTRRQYSTAQYSKATHFNDVVRSVSNAGLRMIMIVMCALRVFISSVRTLTDVVRAQ